MNEMEMKRGQTKLIIIGPVFPLISGLKPSIFISKSSIDHLANEYRKTVQI
jgi:hypothetical protein